MLLPSLSLSPSAPLLLALSLPAKSTRLSLLTFSPMDCKHQSYVNYYGPGILNELIYRNGQKYTKFKEMDN